MCICKGTWEGKRQSALFLNISLEQRWNSIYPAVADNSLTHFNSQGFTDPKCGVAKIRSQFAYMHFVNFFFCYLYPTCRTIYDYI